MKPFVKRQKNDMADSEAIAEAASRPTMRFVTMKSVEQQSAAMAYRTRGQSTRCVPIWPRYRCTRWLRTCRALGCGCRRGMQRTALDVELRRRASTDDTVQRLTTVLAWGRSPWRRLRPSRHQRRASALMRKQTVTSPGRANQVCRSTPSSLAVSIRV